MTRKEHYIKDVLCKDFRLSEATAKIVYSESDALIGGGPTNAYESFKGMYSPHFQTVITAATERMRNDRENKDSLYYRGNDMNEDIDPHEGYVD